MHDLVIHLICFVVQGAVISQVWTRESGLRVQNSAQVYTGSRGGTSLQFQDCPTPKSMLFQQSLWNKPASVQGWTLMSLLG